MIQEYSPSGLSESFPEQRSRYLGGDGSAHVMKGSGENWHIPLATTGNASGPAQPFGSFAFEIRFLLDRARLARPAPTLRVLS